MKACSYRLLWIGLAFFTATGFSVIVKALVPSSLSLVGYCLAAITWGIAFFLIVLAGGVNMMRCAR